jgi:hypothetical protein
MNRSSAVMEQRAPKQVRKDTPEAALFRNLNYFPTPPWAARAIAYRLKDLDPQARTIWEPACGEGHFAEPLIEVFGREQVMSSDIYDYGHGWLLDFLRATKSYNDRDWIVTNPPFAIAGDFIERGLELARRGVIVLCRIAFLESGGREKMLYESEHPLTCIMPFVERVSMQLGSWDPDLSTASCYAAFVFFKGQAPRAHWPFPSGTERRYTRFDDAARFANPAPVPLFEKMAPGALFQPSERTSP